MSESLKFLPGYIAGEYLDSEIEDFIEQWHLENPGEQLQDYLGFTREEWEVWVMDSSTLPHIALARQKKIPIHMQLMNSQDYALAARSDRPVEAEQIIQWLKKNGYV